MAAIPGLLLQLFLLVAVEGRNRRFNYTEFRLQREKAIVKPKDWGKQTRQKKEKRVEEDCSRTGNVQCKCPQSPKCAYCAERTRTLSSSCPFQDMNCTGRTFGVGLGKTGTSTLTEVMQMMRLRVEHNGHWPDHFVNGSRRQEAQ